MHRHWENQHLIELFFDIGRLEGGSPIKLRHYSIHCASSTQVQMVNRTFGGKLVYISVSFQRTALKSKSRTKIWGCAGTSAWQSNGCWHRTEPWKLYFQENLFSIATYIDQSSILICVSYISARATGKIQWTFEEIVWFDQNGYISTCQMPKKHITLAATAAALCQYLH